jgi:Pvc16 N-terminal domain
MRSPLIIAATTAVLKRILENSLAEREITEGLGSDILVSAVPPDRIALDGEERAQVNLFLYQLTPNTGMRAPQAGRTARPMALDLHYLLSVYGTSDLAIEILLEAALGAFSAAAGLSQAAFVEALSAIAEPASGRPASPAVALLARTALGQRIAGLQIAPQFPSLEDSSKLWSALQARYRPALFYKVSIALSEP